MTKKILFSLIIIFFTAKLYAQKVIVLDKLTKKPIPDVHIILDDSMVLTTDKFGVFRLKKPKKSSKIRLSHLNYIDKKIKYKNLKDTLYLVEKTNSLEEVIIQDSKKKTITYVHPIPAMISTFGEIRPLPNSFYAVYIPPKRLDSSLKIKNIVFRRSLKKNKTWAPFNVLLMTVDSITTKPNQIIYRDSIFPSNKEKNKILKIPVSEDLKIPENGIFVVVDIFSRDYYSQNEFYNRAIPYFKAIRLKKNSEFKEFRLDKRRITPFWVEPKYSVDGIQTFDFGLEMIEH